ncbi:HNH endonuclease [Arthrobacter phage Pumancara]|uniref:HNH endonuclease n=1 Tax=Arthrobacter phage Pumancara TaxID=1772311 RepID=A0A0U4K9U8_9CAUD|nr:HNH endonuclease [Arthrobacter phage Pumancara]ALY10019.1 HNH endonuclease [Arthrobacter phage Pumancara]
MAVDEWVNNSGRRRKLYKQLLPNDQVLCWICRQPGANQLDHIKPRSKYPELVWDLSNIVPAHDTCNNRKSDGESVPGLGVNSEIW